MNLAEAERLIVRGVVGRAGGVWADLGAGSGTFTRALASLLGPGSTVHAVDRDVRALSELVGDEPRSAGANVVPLEADFREPLPVGDLDGIVMANSLHFVERGSQGEVLARVAGHLKGGGVLILVEYDQTQGSAWVPFPVPPGRFADIAVSAELSVPTEIGRRRSRYGPTDIYAAVASKVGLH
ncbi:MAG: class I SAM-dependent methyltransferase [Trueperaceae bacterium]|nr:class I SAM-dependent methyltransferase [Trueperaceae bacterium]MCC6309670.1 class I SAM-dependent methyltransferase [Trueperaceae bacterium]MCO5174414.1 class I SAM-dependent methyltransferase [Trueperaceae bacterium]MCW5819105.1 class I SAM-dependent methyltransferase [Trueperaceae bacterium]